MSYLYCDLVIIFNINIINIKQSRNTKNNTRIIYYKSISYFIY